MENIREFLDKTFTHFREFFRSPSSSRTLVLIGLIILAVALPITVTVLQQTTQYRQSAHYDNCPIDEEVCGNNSEVSSWCSSTYPSTSLIHITTNMNCGNAHCTEAKNQTQCGYRPPVQCPSNSPSGSFCAALGTCRAEAPQYYVSGSCGGGQVCCSPQAKVTYSCTNPNDPNNRGIRGSDGGTISCDAWSFCTGSYSSNGSDLGGAKNAMCPNTSACGSANHVYIGPDGSYHLTSKSSCGGYECANGYVSIGGSCGNKGDSTCCLSASDYGGSSYKVTYTCKAQDDPRTNWFSGSDGSVTYCNTGQVCHGTVSTNNGFNDAKIQLCMNSCYINKGATCEKEQCGAGKVVSTAKTADGNLVGCNNQPPDSVCCVQGQSSYFCIDQGNPEDTAYQGSDGSVTYCPTGKVCTGATSAANAKPASDPAAAASSLCTVTFDAQSCSCDNSDSSHKRFSCSNGAVKRSCGNNMMCYDKIKGAQDGLFPCVPNSLGAAPLDNSETCGYNGVGFCLWDAGIGMGHGQYGITANYNETCAAFCPDIPSCRTITNGAYVDIQSSNPDCYTKPLNPYRCCAPNIALRGSAANCQAAGGFCTTSPNPPNATCKAGYHAVISGDLSCGSSGANMQYCCVPQISCQQANGTCSDYSAGCKSGTQAYTSTFSGCGDKQFCCVPTSGKNPKDCGSMNGKCVADGYKCPTNYQTDEVGQASCGTGNYCCVPTGGGGGGSPSPTCDPSKESCGSGGGGGGGCTSGKDTKIAMSVKLDGIGTATLENNTPLHPNRTGKVRVFDTSNSSASVNSSSQAFNFGKNDGRFDSTTIDIGSRLNCGSSYKVEVRIPGYLPATADIKYGDTSQVINLEPLGGDINLVDNNGVIVGDGKIDVLDYNIYKTCLNQDPNTPQTFQSQTTTIQVKCSDLINFFDFQDGGTMESNVFTPSGIGEWDANYNLWVRSYVQANGY